MLDSVAHSGEQTDFPGIFSEEGRVLLDNYFNDPSLIHFVGCVRLDVSYVEAHRIRVNLTLPDGSYIPKAMWAALNLAALKRQLTRRISRTFAMSKHEALRWLDMGPKGPKASSHPMEPRKRSVKSVRKRNRLAKEMMQDYMFTEQSKEFPSLYHDLFTEQAWYHDYDSDDSSIEGDNVCLYPNISYFGKRFRRRPRVDRINHARKKSDVMDYIFGCCDALFAFINQIKMSKLAGLSGKSFRAHLTLAALEFIRCALKENYVHRVVERAMMSFWKMVSHMSMSVKAFRPQAFGMSSDHDTVKKFMMFVIAYPFMRSAATWSEKKTWFENSTTNFYKRGGISDQTDFVTLAFDFFAYLFRVGAQCFQERSLSPLWRTAESYANWYDDASDCVREEVGVGFDDLNIQDYIERLERLVSQGERVLDTARTSKSPAVPAITKLLGQLKELLYSEELLEKARSTKPIPFFIGLYGAPKTGKTFLIDELLHTFFRIRKQEYQERFKYVKSSTDKFDSGLKTYHKAVVVDDVGTLFPDKDEALAGPRFIMELANSTIAASNQADLKDKGRIFARAQIVIATTNHSDFGAKGIIQQQAAYLRRIRYRVSLSLKPEFRRGKANFINEVAVSEYGGSDIHLFNVVEYTIQPFDEDPAQLRQVRDHVADPENSNYKIVEKIVLKEASQEEFFTWYHDAVIAHFAHDESAALHNLKLRAATLCDTCHMLSTRCTCKQEDGSDSDPDWIDPTLLALHKKMHGKGPSLSDFENPALQEQGLFSSFQKFREKKTRELAKKVVKAALREQISKLGGSGVSWGDFGKAFAKNVGLSVVNPETQALVLRFLAMFTVLKLRRDAIPSSEREKPQIDRHLVHQTEAESYQNWIKRLQEHGKSVPLDVYHNTARIPPLNMSMKNAPFTKEQLVCKVRKNQVSLHFPHTNGGISVCGTGMYGDVCMTVRHAFPDLSKPTKILFGEFGKATEVEIHPRDIVYSSWEKDTILFHLKKRFFKDITCFVPLSINYLDTYSDVDFIHCDESYERMDITLTPSLANSRTGSIEPKLEAHFPMKDGSCGGLAIATTSRKRPILLAMHHLLAVKTSSSLMIPLDLQVLRGDKDESRARIPKRLRKTFHETGLRLAPNLPFKKQEYHYKSYVHYRKFPPEMHPLGTIEYPLLRPRTRLVNTPLHGLVPPSNKEIPDMTIGQTEDGYKNPFNDVLDQLCDKRATYPRELLHRAFEKVRDRYVKKFKKFGKSHPLTEKESLNGIDGVRFFDAFKRKTGKGLPKRGPKYDVIDVDGDGVRSYTPEARECVQMIAEALAEHTNPGIVADVNLKDEPKKPGKAVRGFMAAPFAYNDLMRRLVLAVFKIIQENPLLFGISIGMNAESWEWTELTRKHLARLKHILYDFETFDRSHPEEALNYAHLILFACMEEIYSDSDTVCGIPWHQVAAGGFAWASCPIYNVQGTIYEALGSLASGLFHTAVINSIIQELILQMLWYTWEDERGLYTPETEDEDRFKENNSDDKYGDDGFVSTDVEGFDLPFFSKTAARWNLRITDPDKSDPNRKNFPIEMWSFLKRKFEIDSDSNGSFVRAPLELNSVLKTLNYYEPNDMPERAAMIQRVGECIDHISSHRSKEAVDLYNQITAAMEHLYGEEVLAEIPSLKWAWDKKRGALYRPAVPNPHNLAEKAGMTRAEFESFFHGKSFNVSLPPCPVSAF